MKGVIFDVKHFAVHDGPGIRTTVFLKGCPLQCVWCHNPESLGREYQLGFLPHKCVHCGGCAVVCSEGAHTMVDGKHRFDRKKCKRCGACSSACAEKALTLYGREADVEEIVRDLLSDRDFYESSGNGGITLSGGECLTQSAFCEALLQRMKAEGIHTAVDTCGFVSREALDRVIPYTDLFLYDVKAIDEAVHEKCTGRPNSIILENLRYLNARGAAVEIRIPYVPNHNADEIDRIGSFLSELSCVKRVKVLPYHNYAATKYASLGMANTLPEVLPTDTEIEQAKRILRGYGLNVADWHE